MEQKQREEMECIREELYLEEQTEAARQKEIVRFLFSGIFIFSLNLVHMYTGNSLLVAFQTSRWRYNTNHKATLANQEPQKIVYLDTHLHTPLFPTPL